MNYTVEERFVGLSTYGTKSELHDSNLFAASVWSTSGYRLRPTEFWPDEPTSSQLRAFPWLYTLTADPPFRHSVYQVVKAVSQTLADADEFDGIVCVWNAPHTFGLLYAEDRDLHMPKSILDLRLLDRQLNPDRSGRRTLKTTAAQYGIEYGDDSGVLSPELEGKMLVRTARAMLAHHQLAMPFQDLMGQQRVWHSRQSEDLVKWMIKNHRDASHVDRGWPLRDDQRLWQSQCIAEDWLYGDPDITPPDHQVRDAVRVLLKHTEQVVP